MKSLKKLWVSLVLLFSVDTYAISIDVIPDHTSLTTGDTLAVQVKISDLNDNAAPSLGVYDLDFYFDHSLFTVSNILWGDSDKGNQLDLNGLGSLQSSSIGTGVINLFELSVDDIASLDGLQAGEFTLFTVLLDAIAVGAGNFSLHVNALGNAEADGLIAGSVGNAQVAISAIQVPEPSSGLLLLVGILAVILLRGYTSPSPK